MIFDGFLEFLRNNQFASGGLLMGAGAIIYNKGRYLLDIFNSFITKKFIYNLNINSTKEDLFTPVDFWIKSLFEKSKKGIFEGCIQSFTEESFTVVPSSGSYLIKSEIGYVYLHFSVQQATSSQAYAKDIRSINITILAKNRSKLENLLLNLIRNKEGIVDKGLYQLDYGSSYFIKPMKKVNTEAVVLNMDIPELIEEIQDFYKNKKWYQENDITHKRVYLLEGPPGNGKTSLIKLIATNLEYSLVNFEIDKSQTSGFSGFFASHTKKAIFFCEDIDRIEVTNAVEEDKDSPKDLTRPLVLNSLNKILNMLDGIATPDGLVIFLTCNHIEKLDPALKRPGRIDKIITLDNATQDQAKRLFLKFFPGKDELATKFSENIEPLKYCMARLQQYLMSHSSPEEAYSNSFDIPL